MRVIYVACVLLCAFQVSAQELDTNVYAELEPLEEAAAAPKPPVETTPEKPPIVAAETVPALATEPDHDGLSAHALTLCARRYEGSISGAVCVAAFAEIVPEVFAANPGICRVGLSRAYAVTMRWLSVNSVPWDDVSARSVVEQALAETPCSKKKRSPRRSNVRSAINTLTTYRALR